MVYAPCVFALPVYSFTNYIVQRDMSMVRATHQSHSFSSLASSLRSSRGSGGAAAQSAAAPTAPCEERSEEASAHVDARAWRLLSCPVSMVPLSITEREMYVILAQCER